jgi:OmpA-OmpF porin, OOP family
MRLLILFMLVCFSFTVFSQTVKERAKQKTQEKVNSKVDETIDKGIDSIYNKTGRGIADLFKKKDKKEKTSGQKNDDNGAGNNTDQNNETRKSGANDKATNSDDTGTKKVNGFSDFIPGTNIIFEDNFEQDAIGDFPAKWNTNGSGKVVTIDNVAGKWLDVAHASVVHPVLDKELPENCNIEFDLFLQAQGDRSTPLIQFGLMPVKDILKEDIGYSNKFYVSIIRYNENDGRNVEYGFKDPVGSKGDFPLTSYVNKVLHVSMAINKTRIRVYLDQTKLIDLPRALTPEMRRNFYLSNVSLIPAPELGLLVSNIRIAAADIDARSLLIKDLMEKGKAVTSDILFDVNKDIIKKESFSIIDQFGEALQKNSSLKIRIVGHTDADGAAAYNLELSKKRAAAVKEYLMINHSIDASRIATDGKGSTQPVAENNSDAGKAKNRRVEFIKL